MKKISLYLIGLLLGAIVIQSCELETEAYNEISSSLYPVNERDVQDLITGNVYVVFTNNAYYGIFNRANGLQIFSDIASDYGMCSWGFPGPVWNLLEFGRVEPSTDYGANYNYSTNGYSQYFAKMILTIDRIQALTNIKEDVKNKYIAEAKCGLGFLGFLMYDYYGPLIIPELEVLKRPADAKIVPRLSEAKMREFIETNLKEAAEILPATIPYGDANYGRFTAGLCHTLLLKLYMQTGQWAKAVAEGKELQDSKYDYVLVTEVGTSNFGKQSAYTHLFSVEGEGNKETIWAVNQATGVVEYEWFPNVLTTYTNGSTGWSGFKMPWSAFNTFEEDDQRLFTIIDKQPDGVSRIHEHGALPVKYEINVVSGSATRSALDWMIYRYADVLTLYAEALVRNGGSYQGEPLTILNRIRQRAGLAPKNVSSNEEFLEALLEERAHEFYWEGCRRQDLIRYGLQDNFAKYKEVMAAKCAEYNQPAPADNYNYKWFPFPEKVIIEGQGIIKQNPPYGDYSDE